MSRNGSLPFEDLSQVGSLGLLRAIEAFQPSKGRSLSSFAVPYIRGAMKQEIRDRQSLMKIPRDLWELRQRASALQERNRQSLALPLALGALARSLDCEGQKLQEAINLNSITEMRSLDAPRCQGRGAEDHGPNLVEDLADPASLDRAEADISGHDQAGEQADQEPSPSPQLLWLRQRLAALPQLEQALIRGHLNSNASWVELGRELNLHPRQAQRRYQAGLSRLKREAQAWSQGAEGLI